MSSSMSLTLHTLSADQPLLKPLVVTPTSRSVREALREAFVVPGAPESVRDAFDLAEFQGDGTGFGVKLTDFLVDGELRVVQAPVAQVDTDTAEQLAEAVDAIHELLAAGLAPEAMTLFVSVD